MRGGNSEISNLANTLYAPCVRSHILCSWDQNKIPDLTELRLPPSAGRRTNETNPGVKETAHSCTVEGRTGDLCWLRGPLLQPAWAGPGPRGTVGICTRMQAGEGSEQVSSPSQQRAVPNAPRSGVHRCKEITREAGPGLGREQAETGPCGRSGGQLQASESRLRIPA